MFPSYSDPVADRIARFGFSDEVSEKISKAERCFIAGLGPSLAKVNLPALEDEFVIGVNVIQKAGLRPDVICVSDPSRVDKENFIAGCPKIVTARHVYRRHQEMFEAIDTYHDIDFMDAGRRLKNVANTPPDPTFSRIYWAASVIAELAVPLATYLGIKDIYVLGLDGANASFPSNYVGGSKGTLVGPPPSRLFHLHSCIANSMKAFGSSVYNASFGGVVEAFTKVNLHDIKPQAVLSHMNKSVDGAFIVMKGGRFRLKDDGECIRIMDRSETRLLRHRGGRLVLEKDDGTDQFRDDSSWVVEPAFVNKEWVSFQSKNQPKSYITSVDGTDPYILRECKGVFSPYFSSFRLFDSAEQAESRMETDAIYQALHDIKNMLGNIMVRNDRANL